MKHPFETLLDELGNTLNISLHMDTHHACTLLFEKKLSIQLKLDKEEKQILLASFLCFLPPGKFRENVLAEALKENNKYKTGIFAFSEINNQLVFFQYLPFTNLSGKTLADHLITFLNTSITWKEEIEKGNFSPSQALNEKPSLFDLQKKL